MEVDKDIKRLFPNKTDDEVITQVWNPCEDCQFCCGVESECVESCVLGKLWEYYKSQNAVD